MGGFVGLNTLAAPNVQGSNDDNNCCSECHSSSLGSSNLFQNPVAIEGVAVQLCNPNPSRKEIIITNAGLGPIYIGLGFSPTPQNWSFVLPPCLSSNFDGTGGVFVSDMWQGSVFAICDLINFSDSVITITEEV